MEQVLINQKTLKQRKSIKQIQKAAIGKYGRGHGAVAKARIGKLVNLSGQEAVKTSTKGITIPELSQEELLDVIRESKLTWIKRSIQQKKVFW